MAGQEQGELTDLNFLIRLIMLTIVSMYWIAIIEEEVLSSSDAWNYLSFDAKIRPL